MSAALILAIATFLDDLLQEGGALLAKTQAKLDTMSPGDLADVDMAEKRAEQRLAATPVAGAPAAKP